MTSEIKLQKCSVCKCTMIQEEYFSKNKKGEYNKSCGKCLEKAKQYRQANKGKIVEQHKQYREGHKEKVTEYKKQYYQANKEKIIAQNKQYREAHKGKVIEYKKRYYEANKEKIAEYREANKEKQAEWRKQYCKDKRHHCEHNTEKRQCKICDPLGHLKGIVSTRVNHALKADKTEKSIEYLGCTIGEFREHITSQFKDNMTWDNYGEWEIDHITPIKYRENDEPPTLEQVAERLHWTNTQPLWKKDNIVKGNRYIG